MEGVHYFAAVVLVAVGEVEVRKILHLVDHTGWAPLDASYTAGTVETGPTVAGTVPSMWAVQLEVHPSSFHTETFQRVEVEASVAGKLLSIAIQIVFNICRRPKYQRTQRVNTSYLLLIMYLGDKTRENLFVYSLSTGNADD